MRIAQGSLAELETQLEVCLRLQFLLPEDLHGLQEQLTRTGKLLHGLRRSLGPRGDEND